MQLDIFPIPKTLKIETSVHNLIDHHWLIVDPNVSASLMFHLLELQKFLLCDFNHKVEISKCPPAKGRTFLQLIKNENIKSLEHYELTVNENGILISAAHDRGFYYGLSTLTQIIRQARLCLPHLYISDCPDFPNRGVMIDISRCKVPTLDTIKELIQQFSRLKLNQLQLYIEHTFAFSAHEAVWANSSPLSSSDIIEIDNYCQQYFIELVPNLNSFGHFERWLAHPGYRKYAECPDGFISPHDQKFKKASVLKPNQQSLDLIHSLYDEYLPNFTSSCVNVGCDETVELGKGYSKKRVEAIGVERVYLNHLKGISHLCQQYGKTMMFWGDIILHQPELISELPENCIALNWGYEAKHDFAGEGAAFSDANIPFYVAPGTSSWGSLLGRTDNCIANIKNAAQNGLKYGAVGLLNTDWGDNGHHQTLPVSYLGFTTGALYAWNCKDVQRSDIIKATNVFFVQGEDTSLVEVLYDLGNLYKCFIRKHDNHTDINSLFFDISDTNTSLEGLKNEELEKTLTALNTLLQKLRTSTFISSKGAQIKEEIQLNIQMASVGLRWGINILNNNKDMSDIVLLLQKIIGQHEKIWLKRNKEGGLYESSEWLREKLKMIKMGISIEFAGAGT